MTTQNKIIDKNNLTQRELIILLSNQVEDIKEEVVFLKNLNDRVTKVETKIYVVGAGIAVLSFMVTLVINIFDLFK